MTNMLTVSITPQFRKMFRKLEPPLQEEALEKIELFRNPEMHASLKVHKLKGKHKKLFSFSVNYRVHIVCTYLTSAEVVLIAIGDHDVYN